MMILKTNIRSEHPIYLFIYLSSEMSTIYIQSGTFYVSKDTFYFDKQRLDIIIVHKLTYLFIHYYICCIIDPVTKI